MKTNGILSQELKSARSDIANRRKQLAKVEFACQFIDDKLFPKDTRVYYDGYGLTVYIPWGVDNFKTARRALDKVWERTSEYTSESGTITYNYAAQLRVPGYEDIQYLSLQVIMDSDKLNEETCEKILVSEETRSYVVKKYKVVCKDGVTDVDSPVIQDVEEYLES